VKIFAFLISTALFVGGLYVMGSAFYVPGWEYLVFLAGILCSSLGVAIPVHVLKRVDG
jgi:hypothetical protein